MTIGTNPIIFSIGSTEIGWHGILMVIGIVIATLLSAHLAVKKGIKAEAIYTSAFWIVLFGLLGARLTHVIDEFSFYSDNPSQILAFWEGGLGWYGGLLGGIAGGVVYAKLDKIPLGKFADVVGIGVILGLSIGRIGCTINGDSPGTKTSLPWAFTYTHSDAFSPPWPTHPAPVYEIILCLIIFGILWKLRETLKPDGSLFLLMLAMYSFGRFFISWVRAEPSVLGPLHQSHIISILIFAAAISLLAYQKVKLVKKEPA